MIKYVLTERGIQDRETRASIPIAEDNRHYQEYLEWVAEGNTPVPVQPDGDHELVDDAWVLDVAKQKYRQLVEKQSELKAKMLELFEFTFALFEVLKTKAVVENADFDVDLRNKAAGWKQLLDEMSVLE